MHTVAQYGYAVSMTFALITLLIAIIVGLYAQIQLARAIGASVETDCGQLVMPKDEIEVNWAFPAVFLIAAVLWTLIGLGFHHFAVR
jgi:hypothetical protein